MPPCPPPGAAAAPTYFYPADPIAIRDGTAARVKTIPGLANVYSARTMPGQESQMPYAVVWNAGERTKPNGDANVGAPEFEHSLTLVIDVIVRAGIEPTLDADIVALVETIRSTLLTDPSWVALFEGIEKVDTRYAYPKEAVDVTVQAIIEIEVTYRSIWQPVIPNELDTVAVTVERRAASSWTCGVCAYGNPGTVPDCQLCGARPTSFFAEFDLREPPQC